MKKLQYDTVIVGCGVGGLYTALHLPETKKILMLSKEDFASCDSMLAQGGICVMRDEQDYDSFFEDTMRAGHYENRKESVDIMLRSSRHVIDELIRFGVDFDRDENGELLYTKEGAHSKPRIYFHEDVTGKAITTALLQQVQQLSNVDMMEYTTMTDLLISADNTCEGVLAETQEKEKLYIYAADTVLATGGIGGTYQHSTNFPCLTGDGVELAKKHGVKTEHLDYVQIHPTTLYTKKRGRSFLITESARGEGAVLLDGQGNRFTDELQPRDVVSKAIAAQMRRENSQHVWLSFAPIPEKEIREHFPHILDTCMQEGYDITKEPIPVVPAQHYFMGGIYVDRNSATTMPRLYAVGETSCNGVHGKNRLASNSLLESLVFAERAAYHIETKGKELPL